MNNFKQYHRPDDGDTPQPTFRRRSEATNHQKQKQQESTPPSARKGFSQSLAYNKTTYNDKGLLMNFEEKLKLRNRSGYCTECEGPPTSLYNIKRNRLNPLWITKEPRTVTGECSGGICFICHPSLQQRNNGGSGGGGSISTNNRNHNLSASCLLEYQSETPQPMGDADLRAVMDDIRLHDTWLSKIQNDWRLLKDAPEQIRNHKEIVIAAIGQDVGAFRYASPRLQKDDDISRLTLSCAWWLADIKSCKRKLENAPTYIRKNKKIVLTAVQNDGNELRFASPDLRNNKEVAIAAIKQDIGAICYASPQLQTDNDISRLLCARWLADIKSCKRKLENAPTYIRKNKKIVLAAVQNDGNELRFAPPDLRNNTEVAIAAIKQDVGAICYVSPQLQTDNDISRLLCARWLTDIKSCKRKLENAPTYIRKNKKIVLAAVQNDGNELRFATPDLRNDKEVAIAAIKQDFEAICYASPQLQQDDDILYEHWIIKITKNWRLREDAPMNIRDNKKLVLEAIKQDVFAYEYASPQLQEDKDVLDICYGQWLLRVKWGCSLEHVPERIRNDKRIVMAAI